MEDCNTLDTRKAYTEVVNRLISAECEKIKELLLTKNTEYGNAALDPQRIFSRLEPLSQIDVRIDDKLSRINYARDHDVTIKEDTIADLIGYLILRQVAEELKYHPEKGFITIVADVPVEVHFNETTPALVEDLRKVKYKRPSRKKASARKVTVRRKQTSTKKVAKRKATKARKRAKR